MKPRTIAIVIVALIAGACERGPTTPTVPSSSVTLSALRIDIRPLSGNTGLARTWRFQATANGNFSNGSTEDVTERVTWTSSNPAVAVISASGALSAQGPGKTRIEATWQGVTAVVFFCIESDECGG